MFPKDMRGYIIGKIVINVFFNPYPWDFTVILTPSPIGKDGQK